MLGADAFEPRRSREAEGALPKARLALPQAQSAQALAIHQLAALGGRGADAYAAISRPQLQLEAVLPLPMELPVNLLARRPDVIAARARIEAADAGKRAARAAFYPDVTLTALAGFVPWALVGIRHTLRQPSPRAGEGRNGSEELQPSSVMISGKRCSRSPGPPASIR